MSQGSDGLPPGAVGQVDTFRCIGCGYILKLADPLGNCPECGKLVSESRALAMQNPDPPERLSGADRGWVMGMVQGLTWLAFYYIGYVAVMCVSGIVAVVFVVVAMAMSVKSGALAGPGGPGGSAGPPGLPDMSSFKYFTVLAAVVGYGVFLAFLVVLEKLTRAEPGRGQDNGRVEQLRHWGRKALPILGLLMTVMLPFQIYWGFTQSYGPQSPPVVSVWSVLAMMIGFLVYGVLVLMSTVIPAEFASRVGSLKLQKQAKRVVIYAMVWFGGSVLATPLSLIGPLSGNPNLQIVGAIASCPFSLAVTVGGVLFLVEGIMNAFAVGKAAKNLMEPVQ